MDLKQQLKDLALSGEASDQELMDLINELAGIDNIKVEQILAKIKTITTVEEGNSIPSFIDELLNKEDSIEKTVEQDIQKVDQEESVLEVEQVEEKEEEVTISPISEEEQKEQQQAILSAADKLKQKAEKDRLVRKVENDLFVELKEFKHYGIQRSLEEQIIDCLVANLGGEISKEECITKLNNLIIDLPSEHSDFLNKFINSINSYIP